MNMSVSGDLGTVMGTHERSSQSCKGGQSSAPQTSSLTPLKGFDAGML